jgi:hypothetical protein
MPASLSGVQAVRSRQRAPHAGLSGVDREPADGAAAADRTAWELVDELTESLHVAQRERALHGTVHLVLKGRALAGTRVALQRDGHRITVSITAASDAGRRMLREHVASLGEALGAALPDCHVEVSLAV